MTTSIKPGAIVEVLEPGRATGEFAVAVPRPEGQQVPDESETYIWVSYDNGCVVPKREYYVRELTPAQVIAKLNGRA